MADVKPKAEKPKATPKAEKPKAVEKDNDYDDYQKMCELHFATWTDDKYERKCLKENALKELEKLEKYFKEYDGKTPMFDKTLFLNSELGKVRIRKGFPVPDSLYQKFSDAKKLSYTVGKKTTHYFE